MLKENKNSVSVDFASIEQNLQKLKIRNLGVLAIETSKIVGSLSRYNDFSANLIPKKEDFGLRYENIKKAMLNGVNLPPIKVYQVLDNYFVIDGHHRLMAAKELFHAKYIDAEVLEVKFEFEIYPDKTYSYSTESARKFLLKLEEDFFEKKISISNKVLRYPLKVTEFGGYAALLEEIEDYKNTYNGGEFQKKAAIFAAYSWYENRYLPAVRIMKEESVLAGFPNRTYTDLYIWIQKHKYYLSQKVGYDVGFDFTAHDFFKKYKKVKGIGLLPYKIKEIIKSVRDHINALK